MNTLKEYHLSRRMFCIKEDKLIIAHPAMPHSHTEWFEKEGWRSADFSLNEVTRGYVDPKGDVYFYRGEAFSVDEVAEEDMRHHLQELVKKLELKSSAHVFGGLKPETPGHQWPVKKKYGTIQKFLSA